MDSINDDRFDGLFLSVTQQARGIEPLLDTMFSFLRRKTDFFAGPLGNTFTEKERVDHAKNIVNAVLDKHIDIYFKEEKAKKEKEVKKQREREMAQEKKRKIREEKQKQKQDATTAQSSKKGQQQGEDGSVIEIGNDGFDLSSITTSTPLDADNKKEPIIDTGVPPKTAKVDDNDTNGTTKSKDTSLLQENRPEEMAAKSETKQGKNDNDDDDDDSPPPVGNGGTVPDKYSWTQTLSEVNIAAPLPPNTRARDLVVDIRKNHLRIVLKSSPQQTCIADDDLTKAVIVDDSFWTVEDGGTRLAITLQKYNQMEWWDSVCKLDPKINVRKVQPENSSLSDLDGDTRQTVEKMMFDQRQKALGLPTSDDQKKMEVLDRFKAQHPEMDFSVRC